MVLVKAHPYHSAPPRDLRHGPGGDLTVTRHQLAGIAVRGHDRAAPDRERVLDRLLRHVAEVEDHLLAPHRLEQLMPEVGQAAGRAGAAAVPRPSPGRPDDAYAA